MRDEEVIFEFQPIGQIIRVSAFDPATLTEVTIIGPISAGRTELERNAINKLKYVLEKSRQKPSASRRRPGLLV